MVAQAVTTGSRLPAPARLEDLAVRETASLDFEREFVNHLTSEESLLVFVDEGLTPELLLTNRARQAWHFARRYYEDGRRTPTADVLMAEFPSVEIEEISVAPRWLVEKLRERYRMKGIQDVVRELATKSKDPEDAYAYLRESVFKIERESGSRQYIYTADDFDGFLDEYQEQVLLGNTAGFSTGFEQINKFMGGYRVGQLAILAARPKRYKTFFLLQSFLAQIDEGHSPILFSLELTPYETWGRIICMRSGISYERFYNKALTPSEIQEFEWWHNKMREDGRYRFGRPPVGERTVPHLFMEAERAGADSVIIDQLSFLEGQRTWYEKDHLRFSDIIYDLKNAATKKGQERPVLLAAQFNREAASLMEMADAAKVALTGAVEQACDILLGLYRNKDMKQNGLVEFGIIESRNTDSDSWHVSVELKRKTEFKIYEV